MSLRRLEFHYYECSLCGTKTPMFENLDTLLDHMKTLKWTMACWGGDWCPTCWESPEHPRKKRDWA